MLTTTPILSATPENIEECAIILKNGGLVAFPTETVYGLGACFSNESAVKKVFLAKGRPADNPLIVHICSLDQVPMLAQDISHDAQILMEKYFPGPITLLLPKSNNVPQLVTAGQASIALRMPNHTIALQIIQKTGIPLVAPSANTSGRPSPTAAQHVYDDLSGKIDAIIDGGVCKVGIESTVLGWIDSIPTIFRPGIITKEEIEDVLHKTVQSTHLNKNEIPLSPGMKYRHYAPNIPIVLSSSFNEAQKWLQHFHHNVCIITDNDEAISEEKYYIKKLEHSSLYANFRDAEMRGYEGIIIILTQPDSVHPAVLNRINKAVSL
jgi:L-threonylcarbamoyladenylate synthase